MPNPIFNKMEKVSERETIIDASQVMTVNGTIQLTAILGLMLIAAAGFVWSKAMLGATDQVSALMFGGLIVGFISALIITFARTKFLVPVYAISEGLFLGGISSIFEMSYPGIVLQAVTATFAALFSMLILYRTGVIRCTDKFRSVIFIATVSIAGVYLINIIGHFFGYSVPGLHSSNTIGIAISAVITIVAALNLIMDFDFIEKGAERMLPKDYEWFGAFGLMVTIVWLYIEILKLLAKLSNRE